MRGKLILSLTLAIISLQALAIPARRGTFTVRQPDGSVLQVRLEGDEWYRVATTADGAAVTKCSDGYWRYAWYDASGAVHPSSVIAGSGNEGSAAASSARMIPRSLIASRGRNAREQAARSRAEALRRTAATPVTRAGGAEEKAVIILAQFQDLKFKYDRERFVDMLTKPGYSYNGATGSALDYFNDQFAGTRSFSFSVSEVVTLSKSYRYYGQNDSDGNDTNAAEAVAEACRLADSVIDFSQYDSDGDGVVNNVFVFVAGGDEAEWAGDDHIWSHQWSLEYAGIRLTLDGKKIGSYAISSELAVDLNTGKEIFATIGTFCHEYSHCLGLPDLYDTDYEDSGGECDAVWGTTSLMDYGNYSNNGNTPPNYNAVELEMLGIGKTETLDVGEYSLKPLGEEKRYIRADTDRNGEYFLFESRSPSGWDKYIGGEGMLIYHIDKSSTDSGWSTYYEANLSASQRWDFNEVNCNPDHPCCYIVTALPRATDVTQVFWPSGTHTSFTPESSPAFTFWSGGTPEVSVIDIRKESGSGVTFSGAGPLAFESVEEFQDAAIVLWTATGCPSCTISITDPSGRKTERTVSPYEPGRYSFTFEGLSEKTTYKVSIYRKDGEGGALSTSFTTKAFYKDGYPFIYLNSSQRNADGSFASGTRIPLRVFNARGAAEVTWYYSSSTLTSDSSGYYTVRSSGTIEAAITYEDGSKEIIRKTITVKQ